MRGKERRLGVRATYSLPVFSGPASVVRNFDSIQKHFGRSPPCLQRNRQPAPAIFDANPIAIGKLGLAIPINQNVVQDDMDVAASNPMKVAEPWQVRRLHDGDNHRVCRSRYRKTAKSRGW